MASHEESSFLEAVESRLDSIFGADSKPARKTDSGIPEEIGDGAADGLREDSLSPGTGKASSVLGPKEDRSAFLSEIDKRFEAIFGDETPPAREAQRASEPDDLKELTARAEAEESAKEERLSEGLTLFPSLSADFPLKNLQTIVLSLEDRMNESGLERLDDEVCRLDRLLESDPVLQGLLRILRFAGRYIRVKDDRFGGDAAALLFSVYRRMEQATGGEEMAQEAKRRLLQESIEQYQAWVENADLEKRIEPEAPRGMTDGERARDAERRNVPMDEMPVARIRVVEDKSPPSGSWDAERLAGAMKDLPPHEAYALALAEMKKTFQDEIAVLKEEIRLLKAKGNKSI